LQYQVELVVDEKALLGEGPSWDNVNGVLYWVNILGEKVHIFDPETNDNRTINLDQYVGAVVPSESGELILAMQHGFYALDLQTEKLTKIADPEAHIPNNRFNDGKCDAFGRLWAGTMSLKDVQGAGNLYRLDGDHNVEKMIENVTISNGMTWSPDHKVMYYIDTPTRQIVAYDFELETGSICNKRSVIDIPEDMGNPDGMTADEAGMLWVAKWGGSQIGRWDPHTGKLIDAIDIPAPQVTSCSFGGENMDELYITTARVGLDEDVLEKYPHAGGLFRVKTSVKGQKMYPFKHSKQ